MKDHPEKWPLQVEFWSVQSLDFCRKKTVLSVVYWCPIVIGSFTLCSLTFGAKNCKIQKKKLDRVHNNIENDHKITMVPNRSWILAQFGSLIWEKLRNRFTKHPIWFQLSVANDPSLPWNTQAPGVSRQVPQQGVVESTWTWRQVHSGQG